MFLILPNPFSATPKGLKYLSIKKWTITEFKNVFKSKNRSRCAPPAPAEGLYLMDVKY